METPSSSHPDAARPAFFDLSRSERDETLWSWLALLRFFLAAVVVAAHLRWFFRHHPVVLAAAEFGAQIAVIGFFVISGFSIRASLAQHSDGTLAFYLRRLLRIYPLYLYAVLLTHVLNVAFKPKLILPGFSLGATGWATSLGNGLLLQGFAVTTMPFNPALWSLSVEVFYYALAPLFLLLSLRWSFVLMGLTFAYFCLPILGVKAEFFFGYEAFRHVWAWLFGFHFARLSAQPWSWLALAVSLGAVCLHPTSRNDHLSIVTGALVVLVFLCARRIEVRGGLRWIFQFLGDVSYPLYLFHIPLLTIAWTVLALREPIPALAFTLGATIAFLLVIDGMITQRFLKPQLFRLLRRDR